MVVVVDACLPGVQMWWWNPFGAAIFALSGGPPLLLDEAVIRAAGQRRVGDVGFTARGGPAVDVVNLAPVPWRGATRPRTTTVHGMQHNALPRSRKAFRPAAVERFAGVLVIDHQIVIGL